METVHCAECGTHLEVPLETMIDAAIESRTYDIATIGYLCETCEGVMA